MNADDSNNTPDEVNAQSSALLGLPPLDTRPASDYVDLGIHVALLQYPKQAPSPQQVYKWITELVENLDRCGFPVAKGGAGTIIDFQEELGTHIRTNRTFANGQMSESNFAPLRSYARTIQAALFTESEARKTFAVQESVVSETILRMRERDLESHQTAALEDTIRCLECGAFRPAIVMGWNFGYDLIRWWVFNDESRRADFNRQYRPRNDDTEVTSYSDLFRLNESIFLQYCRLAQGSLTAFTHKTERTLVNLLDERNNYAHSNYRKASAGQAQAYVEKVINVYNDPPFT